MVLSKRTWWGLAGWLVLCFAAAALGAVASASAASFYGELRQPAWAPPAWVFGPVWSVLYGLMAVSAWLIWCQPSTPARRRALILFCGQLVVNVAWSWLFFAWQLGGLALIDVMALLGLIVAMISAFWPVSRWAAALMMPYLLWVGFAAALNAAVWQLNPDRLGAGGF